MSVTNSIREKLQAALSPSDIEIIDESELHRGHGGWREGGESHFNVKIVAACFTGLSRVARQRLVMDALALELAGPVHALSMQCLTPDEV